MFDLLLYVVLGKMLSRSVFFLPRALFSHGIVSFHNKNLEKIVLERLHRLTVSVKVLFWGFLLQNRS